MSAPEEHRFTRRQFERMVEAGIFHPEDRLELIEGSIMEVTPQSSRHAAAVQLAQRVLQESYGADFSVRVRMPLVLDPDSSPEPDIAVVEGGPRAYRDAHPTSAVLVVEVADTSLAHDQGRKRSIYARSGIPEYWIVNLIDNVVEVYKKLSRGTYQSVTLHRGGEIVTASIRAGDLLP